LATSETAICERLAKVTLAKLVLLVEMNGQLIASAGDPAQLDAEQFGSLATEHVGRLLNERELAIGREDGRGDVLHFSRVGNRLILLVIFDERSSPAVVQAQSRIARAELEAQSGSIEK